MFRKSVRAQGIRRLLQSAHALELGVHAVLRLKWFLFALEHKENVSLTCRHFGIARSTFLRWARRFDPRDLSTLEERSRSPHAVRMPETKPEAIERVRLLRIDYPTTGKEGIQKLLQERFGIVLSVSTVGRIIARHKFFFAQKPSHQLKRAQDLGSEENVTLRSTPIMPSAEAVPSPEEGGASSLLPHIGSFLFMVCAVISCAMPIRTHAMESASFQMTTEDLSQAEGGPKNSANYHMEGGMTWYQKPMKGPNFQIAQQGPDQASSATSVASTASTASSGGVQGGDAPSGGHRGDPNVPVLVPIASRSSIAARSSVISRASVASIASRGSAASAIASVGSAFSSASAGSEGFLSSSSQASLSSASSQHSRAFLPGSDVAPQHGAAPACEQGILWMLLVVQLMLLGALLACALFLKRMRKKYSLWTAFLEFLPFLCVTTVAFAIYQLLRHVAVPGCDMTVSYWVLPLLSLMLITPADDSKYRKHNRKQRLLVSLPFLCLAALVLLWAPTQVHAATTGPQKYIYNGHLLDSSGQAVTTEHAIRFSEWKSADFVTGDVTGTGAIHTGATTYAGWYEVHTVTPDSRGYFSIELGSINELPNLAFFSASTLSGLYLQVEVKTSAAADTAYELLDSNTDSTTLDRSPINALPFAQNADMIDQRDIGTGSGSIPLLLSGGVLPIATIPGGTNSGTFVLDFDNTQTSDIALQFGGTLNKTLTYDIISSRFEFNDDLHIQGDLTLTGLVNGVDLGNLQSSTGALKVFSGGGLTIKVSGGSYRLAGVTTNYPGNSGVAVTANSTNYVFFGSGGLVVNTTGFPTDESYIALAQVTTNAGAVHAIADRRALQSDDREQTVKLVLNPEFDKASYKGDGTNNVGQLQITSETGAIRNFYVWTSTRTSLQDYEIQLNIPLSEDFVRWQSSGAYALTIMYRSTSASAADNKLDVFVYDTAGAPVSLNGTTTDLANTNWTAVELNFAGSPTWTAGQDFQLKLRVSAKELYQMQIGGVTLNYVDLKQ